MIKKETVIQEFKVCCASLDEQTVQKRETAVKYQQQRYVWEIDSDKIGRIRIEDNLKGFFTIKLFPLVGLGVSGIVEYAITKEEFEELKKLYFGNFKE